MSAAHYFTICAGIGFLLAAIWLVVSAIRNAPTEAMMLVQAERRRQIEKYGSAHDDAQHAPGQLATAGACYAMPRDVRDERVLSSKQKFTVRDTVWPWGMFWWRPTPHDRISELVKAAALIIAEIEREQRTHGRAARRGVRQ